MLLPCMNCSTNRRLITVNDTDTFEMLEEKHKYMKIEVDLGVQDTGPWTRVNRDIRIGDVIAAFQDMKKASD